MGSGSDMASVGSLPTSIEELNALSRDELVEGFLGLDAPSLDALVGELDGFAPDYMLPEFAKTGALADFGAWQGKGFVLAAYGGWAGHGYNVWQTENGTTRHVRFGWGETTSILDGRPSAFIEYAAFDNAFADLDLKDEVRTLADGLYLGIATTDGPSGVCPWPGGPDGRSLPTTFLLRGPTAQALRPDDAAGELRG